MDLYGVRITPTNLYNAVPWSWLVDWFSNARDYVDRASDWLIDSMAAEYFYVMHQQKRVWTYTNVLPFPSGTLSLSASRTVETKVRIEGSSPYGVDVSWDNLTPRQLAILTSLAISR
jgi:hypothetical protein